MNKAVLISWMYRWVKTVKTVKHWNSRTTEFPLNNILSQTELFIVSKSGERRKSPLSSHCAKVGKHNDVWDKCFLKGMLSRWKQIIYLNRSTNAVNDSILTHWIMQYWWSEWSSTDALDKAVLMKWIIQYWCRERCSTDEVKDTILIQCIKQLWWSNE